jgi:uncharacterized membrane-anchored protein YhcB (DUF1043 family)
VLQLQGDTARLYELLEALTTSPQTLYMHDSTAVSSLVQDLGTPQQRLRCVSQEEMLQQVGEFLLDGGE